MVGKLSIAIAGCGVSGLASALFLARAGHRVVIVDRMAAPGPVGSGLEAGLIPDPLKRIGWRDDINADR